MVMSCHCEVAKGDRGNLVGRHLFIYDKVCGPPPRLPRRLRLLAMTI